MNVPAGATVTYKKHGSSADPVTLDSDLNIVIRVTDHNAVLDFTITKGTESVVKSVDISGITFESASNVQG